MAAALLLTGCASTEPTPVTSTPVTTTVTQAPEETAEQATQEAVAETESGVVAESDTQEEPASSPEPEESGSSAPKPSATKTATPTPTPTPSASETPSPTATQTSAPAGYTKAQVAEKSSRSACWVVVSGSVYNLTDWINKHPGGAGAITSLCGRDATSAFEGQHGGDARPSSILESYYLGPLVG